MEQTMHKPCENCQCSERAKEPKQCEACRYFKGNPPDNIDGICHYDPPKSYHTARFAPKVRNKEEERWEERWATWPGVQADNYCSAFEPRENGGRDAQ